MRDGLALLVVLGILSGCGGEATNETAPPAAPAAAREFLPRLTDAHLPPLLAGLIPGTSTVEDVLARFPDLQADEDKSLGGDMVVQYNGHPAVALRMPYKASSGPRGREDGVEELDLYLIPDADGVPRVWSMRLVFDHGDGQALSAWLHEAVGSDPESTTCPGTNRSLGRVGKSPDAGTYCIGTPDGKTGILVECRTTSKGLSELEYDLLGTPATR